MSIDLKAILTPEEYEKPRTTGEFEEWWMTKHKMFGATREGVIYCRKLKGMTKKLYQEAGPMLVFMLTYYSGSPTRCRLLAGTGADDALLVGDAGKVEKRIQVTFAGDGYAEHLRTEELTKRGHVNGLVKPVIKGRGRSRVVVFPESGAIRHDTIVADVVSDIEAAARNKHSRSYSPGYSLVIGFNDGVLHRSDLPSFVALHNRICGWFAELFLVGNCGVVVVPHREAPYPKNDAVV